MLFITSSPKTNPMELTDHLPNFISLIPLIYKTYFLDTMKPYIHQCNNHDYLERLERLLHCGQEYFEVIGQDFTTLQPLDTW